MFTTQRFNSKELALAYVSQQQQTLSAAQFLAAVERAEQEFTRLLNAPRRHQAMNHSETIFEG